MSTATMNYETATSHDEDLQYKALHTGALIAFVLGLLSVCVVAAAVTSLEYTFMLVPIPVVGIFFALRALAKFGRTRNSTQD